MSKSITVSGSDVNSASVLDIRSISATALSIAAMSDQRVSHFRYPANE